MEGEAVPARERLGRIYGVHVPEAVLCKASSLLGPGDALPFEDYSECGGGESPQSCPR